MNSQEKAQCVEWFIQTKSNTLAQRRFRTCHNRSTPSRPSIRAWYKKFMKTGSVEQKKGAGRPRTSEENVEHIQEAFVHSPHKLTNCITGVTVAPFDSAWCLVKTFEVASLQVATLAKDYARSVARKEFAVRVNQDTEPGCGSTIGHLCHPTSHPAISFFGIHQIEPNIFVIIITT